MTSIDKAEKDEANKLIQLVMSLGGPASGNKPPQKIGRYLAREVAKLICDEKIKILDEMEKQETGIISGSYGQGFFNKTKEYLALKQWS